MSELLDRRLRDLQEQLATLPSELQHWEALSRPDGPYEKHHSQIVALARQMRALNDKVTSAWNNARDFAAIQKAQINCAAVHTVWNFFREKLVLRADQRLGDYLRAADAYVWSCYEPVLANRRAANPKQPFREPPLVTFDTEQSPWALSRRGVYELDGDKTGATRSSLFEQTLAAMPIALLGIPWTSTGQLPHLVTLAHESGHVVESDFDLAEAVETALARATAASALCDGWSHHWRKEVFADLFACYVAGPAFVWALADSIPDSPDVVKTRKRPSGSNWGKYPPATLRMQLNLCALRHLGYSETEISAYWQAEYAEHAMAEFESDVELVVPAFYQAADLPAALNYQNIVLDEKRAHRVAIELNNDLPVTTRYNPRALAGAASRLRRAGGAGAEVAWARLQNHIVASRPAGQLDDTTARPVEAPPPWLRTDEIGDILFSAAEVDD
jgi:hypothetical protein